MADAHILSIKFGGAELKPDTESIQMDITLLKQNIVNDIPNCLFVSDPTIPSHGF